MTRPAGLAEARGPRAWLIYVCPLCGLVKGSHGYVGARDQNPAGRTCHNLFEHEEPYRQPIDMDLVQVREVRNLSDPTPRAPSERISQEPSDDLRDSGYWTDWDEMVEDMGSGCPFRPQCEGPYERHHAIPKASIKGTYTWWHHLHVADEWREGMPETLPSLEEALADRRNLVVLCKGHHELVTNRRLYVTREMLPEGIDDFAAELGLGWYMERFYDREDVA